MLFYHRFTRFYGVKKRRAWDWSPPFKERSAKSRCFLTPSVIFFFSQDIVDVYETEGVTIRRPARRPAYRPAVFNYDPVAETDTSSLPFGNGHWLIDWLIHSLIDLLIYWLIDWLIDWSVYWLMNDMWKIK